MNTGVRVKICGLTRAADVHDAAAAGADYVGVIFAGGIRMQTVDTAHDILQGSGTAQRVGVFGNQGLDDIVSTVRRLGLHVAQLHTHADATTIDALRERAGCIVWPVVRVEGTDLPPESAVLAERAGWLLLDSKVSGHLGGSGVALDWAGLASQLRALRQRVRDVRIVLAGGLRAGNVRHAIELLEPDVVDVSSGVERAPGIKDPEAVRSFIHSATAWQQTSLQQSSLQQSSGSPEK